MSIGQGRLSSKLKATSELLNRANHTGKRVMNLPLDSVVPDLGQVRKFFNDESLAGLALSLKNQGQIEPIVVSPEGKDGLYVIQKGERRYRAARIAGLKTIQAIVNDDVGLSDVCLAMQQLAENIQREDLLPQEVAEALLIMSRKGLSNKDISESIGKSQAWVSQHLSILNAENEVLKLINERRVVDATTINELIKLQQENPTVCSHYCNGILSEEGSMVSRADVKRLRKSAGVKKVQEVSAPVKYKTIKLKISNEVLSGIEKVVERINKTDESLKGKVDVAYVLSVLTEKISEDNVLFEDGVFSGFNLEKINI